MNTLVQKELREHFILALIALPIFAVVLVPGYHNSVALTGYLAAGHQYHGDGLQPLLAPGFLNSTLLLCALFGAVLGWMQVRSENHRDLWAFLVHRPISRTRIFVSKLAAGSILYILGAGLPLALVVAMARTPGNVAAPFEWPMVLPVVANFLGGMVCHLAGMITGLRHARWYASRGLGLGAAVAVMAGIASLPQFGQALFIVVAGAVVLGVAAWGAFLGNGWDREQPVMGKIALTAALTGGSLVVVALVAVGFGSLLPRPGVQLVQHESYRMADDGTLYIIAYRLGGLPRSMHLDRSPVVDPETGQHLEIRYPDLSLAFTTDRSHEVRYPYRAARRFFQPWRLGAGALWYWRADGRLVGYDLTTRRMLAQLAPDGPDESFLPPDDSWHVATWVRPEILATRTAIYRVELDARATEVILRVTDNDPVLTARERMSEQDVGNVVVVTERWIQLLTTDGTRVWAVPYEPGHPEYTRIHVSALAESGEYGLLLAPSHQAEHTAGEPLPTHALWLSETEGIHRRAELPALPRPDYQPSFQEGFPTALMPPVLLGLFTQTFPRSLPLRLLLISLAGATLSVVIGWWLGRQRGQSIGRQVAWACFHLLLGLPALLASLSVHDWPSREPCPGCQKPRPIDREHCDHCGAGFASPERNGTEIFEPLQSHRQ